MLDTILSFIMGALSGMGIGGGGLLVIYLTLVRGAGQIEAQGINLYFFIFASIAALFVHYGKRRINYNTVLLLGVAGMPSALAGALLASALRPETVKSAFGYMLLLAGAISLVKTVKKGRERKKEIKNKKSLYK